LNSVSKNNLHSENKTNRDPIIVLFGPTAVGKTELIADLFSTGFEIISADSLQVYRGLDIGTAKPGLSLRSTIVHHLIDVKDPREQFTAGEFVKRADELAVEIQARNRIPVVSGGTAFYLKSFLYGLPPAPPADDTVREEVREELEQRGAEALYEELKRVDPPAAEKISQKDTYRITRALEVYRSSGRPLSSFPVPDTVREGINPIIICLTREREELYARIDRRVELMFELGLTNEVRKLMQAGYTEQDPGMRGIGYREFFLMRRWGCLTAMGVKELIQRNTRRYAKRQITFFRHIPSVHWFSSSRSAEIRTFIENNLILM
jgi:tRNA dimethylallyltransferase